MDSQPYDDPLHEEAVAWVVRLTSGHVTSEDRAHFDAWHALGQLAEGSTMPATTSLSPSQGGRPWTADQASRQKAWWTRRRRWLATAAVVLLLVGLLTTLTDSLVLVQADYQTGIGATRVVTLPDGSTAHLNTYSALAVRFDDRERRIAVLRGEVAFTVVSSGDTRPFIVSARAVDARALGTQFVVWQHEDHTELTVIAHHVAVSTPPSPGCERLPVVLASGQTVRATAHAGLEPVRVVDLRAVTAWQRGRLIFDRVPLRTVLQELNRYHRGYLLLADRTLA